ncbi:amidase domain-containing protein [Pengzhenrongella sicca]|uniref:Amidase domain-containing protein n=1 Tax=Pengzhenrongella sicca TaxID=2819238 RepID=A0A8A4ZC14_9MICO|nr:amidase domain-containing protein [Pengzhenrongella sicca]QTE28549.1 amidase domain-containing protein [Pengzhenrongella sicca]
MSTIFSYGGVGVDWPKGSTWADEHELLIDTSDSTPVVLTDRIVEPPADETPGTPEGAAPVPSSAERPTKSSGTGMATQSEPTPNSYNMQGYALEWTMSPNDGDQPGDFNPNFPYYDNNCANFASQVLHAGGWTYKGGVNPYDTANWTPNLTGLAEASRTWSSAKYQYTFVDNNGYDWLPNIWDATPGNLLYTDWDPNDNPDGTIDHVMVVIYDAMGDPSGPLISQKTPNRGAIPLAQSIAYATADGKTIVWYGMQ